MCEDLGQKPRQRRPRLEQAEQIYAARQPFDDVAQAIEGVVGIRARGDRLKQIRQHRFERMLGRRRTKRARLTRTPVGDVARRLSGIAESDLRQLFGENVAIVRKLSPLVGRKAVEDCPNAIDVRPKLLDQRLTAFTAAEQLM